MASTAVVTQGPWPEEDHYGLDVIAQHNATTSTEQLPPYEEDAKGLGIYVSVEVCLPVDDRTKRGKNDGMFQDDNQAYGQNPPTPRSGTASEGMRTRSGRSTAPRRTDSPFSGVTNKSRISKSPVARSKKDRKSTKLDKSKTPKLTAPLSVLTKDMDTPKKDMEAWVHRSADVRRKEVEKRNGYVTRPMNSFMLYRSCYAERTKQWCLQNNHQIVSSVAGESWPMEPEEVRNQFNEWAKIERANHAAAHPEYKFSPSKSNSKRRKGDMSDDEDDGSDLDGDPDGEYRGGSRQVRQRRHVDRHALPAVPYLASNAGYETNPYYGQPYDQSHYGYTSEPSRSLPSNVSYEPNGIIYNPHTGTYHHTITQPQQPQYAYLHSDPRNGTPSSMADGNPSLGGYGLPSGHISADELFVGNSRTGTPAMQQSYNHYSQPVYPQYPSYTPQPQYQPPPPQPQPTPQQQQQLYEHQQYLQQAMQPQAAIDPSLEAELAARSASAGGVVGGENGQSHFEEAMEGFGGAAAELVNVGEYFDEPTSPMGTRWDGGEMGGQ